MADSRILPTKEELAVQKGAMNKSSFFRVEGDDKFYWMKFTDKTKASRKNRVYSTALDTKVFLSPITIDDQATKNYLKIDIEFLRELFGQELKDSYTVREIVKQHKENNKGESIYLRYLSDAKLQLLIELLKEMRKLNVQDVELLKGMKKLKVQDEDLGNLRDAKLKLLKEIKKLEARNEDLRNLSDAKLGLLIEIKKLKVQNGDKDSVFSRVEGDKEFYWMKVGSKKAFDYKTKFVKYFNPHSESQMVVAKNYLKISIVFLQQVFGPELQDSYSVNEISVTLNFQQILNDRSSQRVIPNTQELIKSKEELKEQDKNRNSVFFRLEGDGTFYWMKVGFKKTKSCKQSFDWAFNTLACSPISTSEEKYLKISIVYLQQVFGPELKYSYSVNEIIATRNWLKLQNDKIRISTDHATNEVPPTPDYEKILSEHDVIDILARTLGIPPIGTHEVPPTPGDTLANIESMFDNHFAQVGTQENPEEMLPDSTDNGLGVPFLDPEYMGKEQLEAYLAQLEDYIDQNLGETATTGEEPQDETLQLQDSVEVIPEELNGPAPEETQENKSPVFSIFFPFSKDSRSQGLFNEPENPEKRKRDQSMENTSKKTRFDL